eukprot:TRINITY_DN4263_c0_g1_i2.p1 TRINITY_DN4263_c0_g1~~TRINITY_DN4263_c0_g1_i2.p1  ORF type:complete len:482 (+),score=84.61 TRINITY_DN4263_c0_g1_i2:64-1509(+)
MDAGLDGALGFSDESDDDLDALLDDLEDEEDEQLLPPTKSHTIKQIANTSNATKTSPENRAVEPFKTPTFTTPQPKLQARSQPSQFATPLSQLSQRPQSQPGTQRSQPSSRSARHVDAVSTNKPNIPGAFGRLPPLSDNIPMNIKFRQLMQLKGLHEAISDKDQPTMSPAQSFADNSKEFADKPWQTMLKDAKQQPWGEGRRYNLALVKEEHTPGRLPFVLARVYQLTYRNRLPSLVLHDPSGRMNASLHPKIMELPEASFLQNGAVLVLYDIASFEPTVRTPCLNITLRNLLRIYPLEASVGDQPYQPITVSSIPATPFRSKRRATSATPHPRRMNTSTATIDSTSANSRQAPRSQHLLTASSQRATGQRYPPGSSQRGATLRTNKSTHSTPLRPHTASTGQSNTHKRLQDQNSPQPAAKAAKQSHRQPLDLPPAAPSHMVEQRFRAMGEDDSRMLLSQSLEMDDDELDGLLDALDSDDE